MSDKSLRYWLVPLFIYGVPNLLLYWVLLSYGLIIVDMVPIASSVDGFTSAMAIILVVLSFFLVMYCGQFGKKLFPITQRPPPSNLIGVAVWILQLLGLLVLFLFDFGRVGGISSSGNPLVLLLSYLHIDAVFLVYYGHRRSKDVPVWNLLLFLISGTLRGWSGMWLMLFFIEVYYALQRLTTGKFIAQMLFVTVIGLMAYPIINSYKDSVRGTVQLEEASFVGTFGKMLVRLQQVGSTLLIAQEHGQISAAIEKGEVRPFFADNTIGGRLLGLGSESASLQKYLSINFLIDFEKFGKNADLDELGWYVHTGIAGWLFVIDWYLVPLYLLFVVVLIVLPYWIVARFIGSTSIIPVLHMAAVLYVFHGWFSVQIGFIVGTLWYVAILRLGRWVRI